MRQLYLHVPIEKLMNRYQEIQAELRAVSAEKAEKEKLLEKAKAQEEFLNIPIGDVKMTDIKLGDGGYGGMSQSKLDLNKQE